MQNKVSGIKSKVRKSKVFIPRHKNKTFQAEATAASFEKSSKTIFHFEATVSWLKPDVKFANDLLNNCKTKGKGF